MRVKRNLTVDELAQKMGRNIEIVMYTRRIYNENRSYIRYPW